MKQNKYDRLVHDRGLVRAKIKKPRVARRRGYPLAVERAYQVELSKYFRKFNKIIKEIILAQVPQIKSQAQRELGLKFDAYDDELDRVFEQARLKVTQDLPDDDLERIIRRKGLEVNQANKEAFNAQYQSVVGVDYFATEPWLNPKTNAFVKSNVRLITKLKEESFGRVAEAVNRGVSRGNTLKSITEEVQKAANVTKGRAKLIARDQVSSLNAEITKIRQKDAGLNKYVWSTSLDERVRDEHANNEGRVFSWDDPPPEGHPGEDINCRCVALPFFEEE